MAPKKTPIMEDLTLGTGAEDADLEQAIDDLRGVLKSDATGTAPAGDFGSEFPETSGDTDLSSFGGGFDADFGGTDTVETAFGGGFDAGEAEASAPSSPPGSGMTANLDLIMDIPIDVQIVLGSSQMQVSGLMNLTEGATIALDRKIGEPVDIMVNGRVIGRGEITVLDNDDTRFGVKLTEVKSTRKI